MHEQYVAAIEDAYQRELGRFLTSGDIAPVHIRDISRLRDDRLGRDLLRLREILSEPADGRDLLRQVAQVSSGIFGVQAIAVVKE